MVDLDLEAAYAVHGLHHEEVDAEAVCLAGGDDLHEVWDALMHQESLEWESSEFGSELHHGISSREKMVYGFSGSTSKSSHAVEPPLDRSLLWHAEVLRQASEVLWQVQYNVVEELTEVLFPHMNL